MDNRELAGELVKLAKALVSETTGKTRDGKKWRETTKGFVAMDGDGGEVYIQTQGKEELAQKAKDLLKSSTFEQLWKKAKKAPRPMPSTARVIWMAKYSSADRQAAGGVDVSYSMSRISANIFAEAEVRASSGVKFSTVNDMAVAVEGALIPIAKALHNKIESVNKMTPTMVQSKGGILLVQAVLPVFFYGEDQEAFLLKIMGQSRARER